MSLASLSGTWRFFRQHPLTRDDLGPTFGRYLRWQIGSRVLGHPVLVPFVGDTKLLARSGETSVTGNIYCGLAEFEDMAFVLHLLRADDVFDDIGANIGTYTILGALTGAQVVAFEPIPSTFERLRANLRVNGLQDRVRGENVGLGDHADTIRFTASLDTINRVATPDDRGDTVDVPVRRLDDYLADAPPTLIKMDVEGYEIRVLDGARKTLAHSSLQAMIVEVNENGRRFGHAPDDIAERIKSYGFKSCAYDPLTRQLTEIHGALGAGVADNQIFVRDIAWAASRLRDAPRFKVVGREI